MGLKNALLIIDAQNDFCAGGSLAVSGADTIIPVLNRYIGIFAKKRLLIFASRDWHPKKTGHFKQYGGLWPKHCMQNTKGARFHPGLKLPKEAIILSKGMDKNSQGYSDLESVDQNGIGFIELLKNSKIGQLYVGGLATDYCVKYTVLDILKTGFRVKLLMDAIKGVDLRPKDSKKAIDEMVRAGAKLTDLNKRSKLPCF